MQLLLKYIIMVAQHAQQFQEGETSCKCGCEKCHWKIERLARENQTLKETYNSISVEISRMEAKLATSTTAAGVDSKTDPSLIHVRVQITYHALTNCRRKGL